jgi:hypothetical protein
VAKAHPAAGQQLSATEEEMGDMYLFKNLTILGAAALVGCASDKEQGSAPVWQGETPHLSIEGRLNGEDIAIEIDGDGAANGTRAWCAREYEAPLREDDSLDLTQATSTATEINGSASIGGEERTFELELRDHALHRDEVGASLAVVPDDTEVAAGELQIEWEWHIGDVDLFEASAQDGHVDLELFTGNPGSGGIVIPSGEGSVGGVIEARWSLDESLSVSFTLPCMATEVEGL